MVAEKHADDSSMITDGEEHEDRGETDLKDKEKMTAEVEETNSETEEVIAEAEEAKPEAEAVVIAEGDGDPGESGETGETGGTTEGGTTEGGSSDGAGGSDAGFGNGAGGSDAGSGNGSGGSDAGSGSGSGSNDAPVDATIDPSEELKRVNADTEQTQAEVLEHSIDTHESVESWCGGDPVHVVEVTERIVETLEQAETVIAEKDQKIKELETRIAELEQIETKYNAIVAEEEAKILAQKQEKARVFAEKQGLDMNEPAVAEAVKALDYSMIAELTMAQVQDDEPEQKDEEPVQRITLASFVELDVGEQNNYGGLLNRRNK